MKKEVVAITIEAVMSWLVGTTIKRECLHVASVVDNVVAYVK
jgi:hypothetical protein